MTYKNNKNQEAKINPKFTARLLRLGPRQKVRAIIVLRTEDGVKAQNRRQSPVERQARIEAMHKSAEPALKEIDNIIEQWGGKRLETHVDALGSIPVETTAGGIIELAASDRIKAILEDQQISLLPKPKHP